jgi:hypothetical protein
MPRPNLRDLFTNWMHSDLPSREKLRMAVRNNLIKLRTGSNCCGHPGEPGC